MRELIGKWGEPPDLPGDPPDPKPQKPPAPPPAWGLASDTGIVLPIAFGTVRVQGKLIERYAYTFAATNQQQRAPSIPITLGAIWGNFGYLYICTVAGTTGTGAGPSGTGAGQVDGGVTWDYVKMGYRHFVAIAFCEGQIFGAGKAWQDKNVFAAYTSIPRDSFLVLALGTPSGGRPTGPAFFPVQTDVYGNTVVLYTGLNTGSDADLPNTDVEIKGIFTDGTHSDANPADIAIDLLTHARRGAQWPSARVDAVTTGSGAASWRTYATAYGLNLSWLIESQQSAKSLLRQLLEATNTDAVMTNRLDGLGWMLKFVPLCDVALTANGVTFTPSITPAYSLTLDDLLDPIEIDAIAATDTYNSFPVEFTSRSRDYARDTVDDPDMADVDGRGLVRAPVTAIPMVMTPDTAVMLSRIKAQRSLNVRNKYRFNLPYRFLLVEPTDALTVTDSVLGLTTTMRVTAFEEDQSGDGLIKIEAEDFPSGVGAAASYTPQVGTGFKPTVATNMGALSVLPGQAPAIVVPDASSTRGGATGNLYPNPISETSPPDGVDTTTAEWKGRTNAVTAYTGSFTRTPGLGASLSIDYDVPAAPNETYYFEAQVKATAAAANKGGFLKIEAFDVAGASLGSASSNENDTTSFARLIVTFLMPANTVRVRFSMKNGTDAAAQAYFDVIYARKAISAGLIEASQVVNAKLSQGLTNFHNLWPNPTSEIDPPATYINPGDGTDPEFDFRYNAGAGAYAGSWVRRLVSATGAKKTLTLWAPCSPGEYYDIVVQYKWISGSGSVDYFYVEATYWAADKTTSTGVNGGNGNGYVASVTGNWVQGTSGLQSGSLYVVNQGGANTAYAKFVLELSDLARDNSGTANHEVQIDAIYARRMSDTRDLLDGAVSTAKIGGSAVTAAKVSTQETWNAVSFAANWANETGTLPVSYMKDHLGFVHLRGTVKSSGGTPGTTVFTLPSGYRPSADARFCVKALDGSAIAEVAAFAYINSAGVVIVTGFNRSNAGPANCCFDGITFDTR